MEAGRERRDRVPDRSPRRSIVGQPIKGTLIVASDEQWRHRNYRYTPDTPFSPLDTRALSLSLSPRLPLVRSFRAYHPSCTRCRPRRVYTRKTPMEQADERILRVATLVRAPLSGTLLECRDGADTCSVQTIHPLPRARTTDRTHPRCRRYRNLGLERVPTFRTSVEFRRSRFYLGRAVSSSLFPLYLGR